VKEGWRKLYELYTIAHGKRNVYKAMDGKSQG
jgi:hypothetical protein